jgi:DNA replication and repair protein RecF
MLQSIKLVNFRNFKDKTFRFPPNVAVIVGPNASGKTNILEAINLISTGKSFKAGVEEEMIAYDKEIARIVGKIHTDNIEVVLTRGVITRGNLSEKIARKRLLINGVGKRLIDFAGRLKTVLFLPKDLDLVTESPSLRRKFMDVVLSQIDYEYRRSLLSYEKGLRRRNKLLLRIREEAISRSHLFFWDKLIIKNGEYITQGREELVSFINETKSLNETKYELNYDKSVISEARLAQYKLEEVAAATTLVGPHRDDIMFKIEERDLAKYGSRGEQRMGTLWLKMAELAFVEEKAKQKPTLLLDDIFSELDHEHRELVSKIVDTQQTIITSADEHYIVDMKGTQIIEL